MSVRIAFIGADGRALAHWNSLRLEAVQCVGVCDGHAPFARSLAKACAAPVFPSARALFEAVQPDAVWICLAPHAHRDAEILAAEHGCALLIETPIAASLETAKRVRSPRWKLRVCYACRACRGVTMRRGYAPASTCRRHRKSVRKPSRRCLQPQLWRARKSGEFDQFAPHAAPICDAMHVLGGGVQAVLAIVSREENRCALAVTLQLKSGVLAQWSLHLAPRVPEQTQWLLSGKNGSAQLSGGEMRLMRGRGNHQLSGRRTRRAQRNRRTEPRFFSSGSLRETRRHSRQLRRSHPNFARAAGD